MLEVVRCVLASGKTCVYSQTYPIISAAAAADSSSPVWAEVLLGTSRAMLRTSVDVSRSISRPPYRAEAPCPGLLAIPVHKNAFKQQCGTRVHLVVCLSPPFTLASSGLSGNVKMWCRTSLLWMTSGRTPSVTGRLLCMAI